MKFLLVASYAESLVNFRGDLIRALKSNGLEVHVAAPNIGKEVSTALNQIGVYCHEIPLSRAGMNPLKDMLSLFYLWRLMLAVKPDFMLGYTIKPVIYGILAAYGARVPHRYAMITGLGYAFSEDQKHRVSKRLVRWLYSSTLSFSSKVFFQNPDDKQLFLEQGILSSNQQSVVSRGSGVNISRFAVKECPFDVSFLLIGRLLGEKGVREYVSAAALIREDYPSVRFKLAGWIDENPDSVTKDELDSWVKKGDIEFLGRLKDVRPTILNSSIFVLPSYREGTPRTVLEAMSIGRPIITTDAPGCRETVTDGVNGFLVPVRSVDALARAMREFLENPDLISNMGKSSRAIAEEKYDVNKVNEFMLREMGLK